MTLRVQYSPNGWLVEGYFQGESFCFGWNEQWTGAEAMQELMLFAVKYQSRPDDFHLVSPNT